MSSAVPAVFITVPKYVAITPSPMLPKIRPAPAALTVVVPNDGAMSPCNSSSGYASSSGGGGDEGVALKGKKRRLDHLSWEEKVQRKKLKNRVAAQTSRDRKKARMEEMDVEINDLQEKTELLQNKCESLQAINDSLLEKNQRLDMEVETLRQQLTELQQQQQNTTSQTCSVKQVVATCAGCESIINGSAVSKNTDPQQQGSTQMDSQSTREQQQQQQQEKLKRKSTPSALWEIVALCLLYKICSSSPTSSKTTTKNSMLSNLRNLPKGCSLISQQTWRQAIQRAMQLLPKMQAVQSDCLDQWWGPQNRAWNPAEIEMAA